MNKTESKLVLELRAENAKFQKDIDEANNKLKAFGQTAERQTKQVAQGMREMDVATRKANHAIGMSSNQMNQFGVQMQDVIVQAQMGTSAFTILAQQGSQLAGAFGPSGALIGGVVALSAAIGGMLWRSMNAAAEKSDELREALDQIKRSTDRFQTRTLKEQIEEQNVVLSEQRAELAELQKQWNDPGNITHISQASKMYKEMYGELVDYNAMGKKFVQDNHDKIIELNQNIGDSEAALADMKEDLANKEKARNDKLHGAALKAEEERNKAIVESRKQLEKEIEQIKTASMSPLELEAKEHQAATAKILQWKKEGLDKENEFRTLMTNEVKRYSAEVYAIKKQAADKEAAEAKKIHDAESADAKKAQDALLRQTEEFNRKLAAIQSGQVRQEGPESQENALFAKNMEALQAAANSKLQLEYDVNALIEAERARHSAVLAEITGEAARKEAEIRGKWADDVIQDGERHAKELADIERQRMKELNDLLIEYDPVAREMAVHEARMAMLQDEHNQRLMTEANFNAAIEKERIRHERAMSQAKIEEMQASGDHIGALMAKYRFDAENSAAFFSEVMANSIDGFVSNLSHGIAQAIVYGEDLRDVFDQVGKMILTSVLQGMIQMGTQILINKAMGTAATAATTTEQVASMGTIAVAAAPAAAGVSAATAGANTVPASSGLIALYAIAGGLAVAGLAGMAHDGIASVPREGTWLLDKGERVLSSDHNERFVKAMEGESRGGVSVTNVFQVSAGVAGTVRAEIEKTLPAIQRMSVAAVESALRSGGSTSRAAGVR